MNAKKIEHYDQFGDSYIFWIEVDNVKGRYKELARWIDKSNYSESCFGICVEYVNDKIKVISDNLNGGQLYYVANDGSRHWFFCKINKKLQKQLLNLCREAVQQIEAENV